MKIKYLLSGRLLSDMNHLRKIQDSWPDNITFPEIVENLESIDKNDKVLTYGYLGQSAYLIKNHNPNKVFILDNAIFPSKGISKFRILNGNLDSFCKNTNSNSSVYKDYYEKKHENFEQVDEWVIDTIGSNLMEMLSHYAVDSTRVITNDIIEVSKVLGIDAARNLILQEFNETITNNREYINFRHTMLLADSMTCRGRIITRDRHGVNKTDIGPLAKASFEETQDVLINAAVFGELDKVRGVSSNII